MRIALITCAIGESANRLAHLTLPSFLSYTLTHKIDFILNVEGCHDRHPAWAKILVIRQNLPKYDWVWWLDLDVIIMKMEVSILPLIDENYDIIMAKDPMGNLNTGSLLIKNTSFVYGLFDRMWKYEEFLFTNLWENSALIEIYKEDEEVRKRIKIIDPHKINSTFYNYQTGDFLAHLAGTGNLANPISGELRIKIVKLFKKSPLFLNDIRKMAINCSLNDFIMFVDELAKREGVT